MSILDDAIRQHLELKRSHGADDLELKRLEDEAFGPPQRPDEIDPFAEAPTEFLVSPAETPAPVPEIEDDSARTGRRPDIADLQEAPPMPPADSAAGAPAVDDARSSGAPAEEFAPIPDAPPPSPSDAADEPLPPPVDELPPPSTDAPAAPSAAGESGTGSAPFDQSSTSSAPNEENAGVPSASDESPGASSLPEENAGASAPSDESPTSPSSSGEPSAASSQPEENAGAPSPPEEGPIAMAPDDDAQPDPEAEIADAGPSTEERHAIADQPTQMFDVVSHVDAEAEEESAAPEENVAPPEARASSASENVIPGQEPLDLRGPDAEVAGHPPAEAAPSEEESAEFDFLNEQRLSDELDQALEAPLPPTDEHIAMPRYGDAPPAQESIFDFESEAPYEEDPSEEVLRRHDAPEPPSEEYEPPSEEAPRAAAEPPSEEADTFDPDTGHEDVLEDTPTFLEDAPEDDDLWFEQRPPKDFDL